MDWPVDFDGEAVADFEEVKSRGDRKAIFNAVKKLLQARRALTGQTAMREGDSATIASDNITIITGNDDWRVDGGFYEDF